MKQILKLSQILYIFVCFLNIYSGSEKSLRPLFHRAPPVADRLCSQNQERRRVQFPVTLGNLAVRSLPWCLRKLGKYGLGSYKLQRGYSRRRPRFLFQAILKRTYQHFLPVNKVSKFWKTEEQDYLDYFLSPITKTSNSTNQTSLTEILCNLGRFTFRWRPAPAY